MTNVINQKLQSRYKDYLQVLKSKNAWKIIFPLFLLLVTIGFFAPDFLGIINFKDDSIGRLTGNLLTGFIAMPSLVLTIAAILFAILQVNNRKLTIIEVVFENSFVIPVVYWALVNLLSLCLTQLFSDTFDSFYTLRVLVCLSYNFTLLIIALFFTLYRCFRYINYANITDDYLANVRRLLTLEKSGAKGFVAQSMRQKGKEVYIEIADAIRKDDVTLVRKYLESFAFALSLNPSSNYVADFNNRVSSWILSGYRTSGEMFSALIEFWRSHLIKEISGEITFSFNNFDRVPLITYKKAEHDAKLKTTIAQVFSLRLKEIAQRFLWLSMENDIIRPGTNFDRLIKVPLEFNELIRYLSAIGDIKSLAIVVNDLQLMRDSFVNNEYRGIRVQQRVSHGRREIYNFPDQETRNRFELTRRFVIDIEAIILGNLYWLYFNIANHGYNKEKNQHTLMAVEVLERQLRYDDLMDTIVELFALEGRRYQWEDWIWDGEERLNGRAYALKTASDLFAQGFAITLVHHPEFTPGRHQVADMEQLRFLSDRTRTYLTRVAANPERWADLFNQKVEQIGESVRQALAKLDRVDQQVELNFLERLAAVPVSKERLDELKNTLFEQWDASRNLSRIFEYFDAVEINPEENLQDSGLNMKLARGKVLIAEGDLYQFIYGIEWGKEANRGAERRFSQQLAAISVDNKATELSKIIQDGIDRITDNKLTPNVIFISMDLFYTNELALAGSGKYSSINNHVNPYPFEIVGFFNNELPVVVVDANEFTGLIGVASIPEGCVMQQRHKEEYIKERLGINVKVLNDAEAAVKREEIAPGSQDPQLLNQLMTDLYVNIEHVFDFKIINARAVIVFKSQLITS